MGLDWGELRKGLAETRPYLLSHHLPGQRHRCYRLRPFGRRIDVCARCSGIYPGIVLGVLGSLFGPGSVADLVFVVVLPLPALIDWMVTSLGDYRGSNPIRTATGALLGYAYGLGLATLFLDGDPRVLVIGLGYAATAAVLLGVERVRWSA